MNKRQKESTAKYFYDMSKGIALLAAVGNIVQEKWHIPTLIFGFIGAISFFVSAYMLEGDMKDE